jgi:hypothetical protein
MKKSLVAVNAIGLVLAALYLLGALVFGPKLAFRNENKQDVLRRIENAATGREAANVARPFLSLMMNVINSANGALWISCGLMLVNGCIFCVNVMTVRKSQPPESKL